MSKSGETRKAEDATAPAGTGMEAFRRRYPKAEAWLIGAEGIALETFFARDPETFFE